MRKCVFKALPNSSYPDVNTWYYEPFRLCCQEMWRGWRAMDYGLEDYPDPHIYRVEHDKDEDTELEACPFCKAVFIIEII